MQPGQRVLVETYDKKLIECRVIELRGEIALVCGESEWRDSKKEKREPLCVGLPVTSLKSN